MYFQGFYNLANLTVSIKNQVQRKTKKKTEKRWIHFFVVFEV